VRLDRLHAHRLAAGRAHRTHEVRMTGGDGRGRRAAATGGAGAGGRGRLSITVVHAADYRTPRDVCGPQASRRAARSTDSRRRQPTTTTRRRAPPERARSASPTRRRMTPPARRRGARSMSSNVDAGEDAMASSSRTSAARSAVRLGSHPAQSRAAQCSQSPVGCGRRMMALAPGWPRAHASLASAEAERWLWRRRLPMLHCDR
jgi:hypothetical protein